MNDFTKEELNIIYLDMTIYAKKNVPPLKEASSHLDLKNKIQSLIDNYCEHEWENICCQCTLDKIYCHKCKKDMGDLKERYDE